METPKHTPEEQYLCDECKFTRDPFEHRCLGNGCTCERCEAVRVYAWLLKQDGVIVDTPIHLDKVVDLLIKYKNHE